MPYHQSTDAYIRVKTSHTIPNQTKLMCDKNRRWCIFASDSKWYYTRRGNLMDSVVHFMILVCFFCVYGIYVCVCICNGHFVHKQFECRVCLDIKHQNVRFNIFACIVGVAKHLTYLTTFINQFPAS